MSDQSNQTVTARGVRRPQQGNAVGRSRRRTVTNNNNNTNTKQRFRRRNQRPGRVVTTGSRSCKQSTPWFVVSSGEISTKAEPGVLYQIQLHPANMPDTPYQRMCTDWLMRREDRIQVQLRCTTATTTGTRIGFVVLNDPSWQNQSMTKQLCLSLIAGRMGSEYTVTQTQTQQRNFTVPTTTRFLSNALATNNQTGCSSGVLVLYLLDAPVAIGGDGVLTWDLMIRFDLTLSGPCANFIGFATGGGDEPGPGPGPDPTPTPTSSFTISFLAHVAHDPIQPGVWLNSHTGDFWLAGGKYLRFPDSRPSQVFMDTNITSTTGDITVTGMPLTFAVYKCSVVAEGQTNDRTPYPIVYWTTWHEPASGLVQLVGFKSSDYTYAQNMANKQEGTIPHGHQLCLKYDAAEIKWQDIFKITIYAATSLKNGMNNGTDTQYHLTFSCVYKSKYSTNVWKNTNRVLDNPQVGLPDSAVTANIDPTALDNSEDSDQEYDDVVDADLCEEFARNVISEAEEEGDDEVDAGFRVAARYASSHTSDGSKKRNISCLCFGTSSRLPTTLTTLMSPIERSVITQLTPTSCSPPYTRPSSPSFTKPVDISASNCLSSLTTSQPSESSSLNHLVKSTRM